MKCKECGSQMQELVECHEELDIGVHDDPVRKTTTHKYKQCLSEGCGYTVSRIRE